MEQHKINMFKVTMAEGKLNLWPRSWALGIPNTIHKEGPYASLRKLQCQANLVNNAVLTTLRFRCQSPSTCAPWAPQAQECYTSIPSPPTFGGDSGTLPCQTGPLGEIWIKSWVLFCDLLTSNSSFQRNKDRYVGSTFPSLFTLLSQGKCTIYKRTTINQEQY